MLLEVWTVKDEMSFLKSYDFTETLYPRLLQTAKHEQHYWFLVTQTIIAYEYLSRLDLYLMHLL